MTSQAGRGAGMTSQDEMVGATHTALIAVLTLEEKVRLLTGRDTLSLIHI